MNVNRNKKRGKKSIFIEMLWTKKLQQAVRAIVRRNNTCR